MPASLGGDAIVRIWERGRREHPVDRALTVLGEFCDASRAELAALPLARRDALLLACRARVFDDAPAGAAQCPRCGCELDVPIAAEEAGAYDADGAGSVEAGGASVAFRAPTSLDLAAIAGCGSVEAARHVLAERCAGAVLDDLALEAVERELARQSGTLAPAFAVICPACAHEWSVAFDAGDFLWHELAALAQRLMRDVDVLARRYGWSEREILGLSAARRRFYLELAS
jgi:hypothetical protein